MGKWDKDKEMGRRLDAVFALGDYLVVYGMNPAGEVATDIGTARKTTLEVAPLDRPQERAEVSTLSSPIADKAELPAEPGDFPIVAQLLKVPTKRGNPALVLQYVRDFADGHSTPTPTATDSDIPY